MTHSTSFSHRWRQIQQALLNQKAQINRAIREYPLPITACDDQFNYLLEKRSAITLELGRLKQLEEGNGETQAGGEEALEAFIAASQFVDGEAVSLTEVG